METKPAATLPGAPPRAPEDRIAALLAQVERRAPEEAVALLEDEPDAVIAQVLAQHNASMAVEILLRFKESRRQGVVAAAPPDRRDQWTRNQTYPEGSIGRLM
jgi:magnesium transporter